MRAIPTIPPLRSNRGSARAKTPLRRRAGWARLALAVGLASVVLVHGGIPDAGWGQTESDANEQNDEAIPGQAESRNEVLHLQINSIIHPVTAEFVLESLEEADRAQAAALVMELNTPGGLLSSTREIFSAMLGARTPVVVYVSPSGSQAASAGFFLLMAADIAAMAPGTNTGAAHPVGGQGEDIEGVMGEKVEQDAAATIRSLAEKTGRNQELAEEAVVKSRSFTADEALEGGLIDLIAPSVSALVAEISGREVKDSDGTTSTLKTADATIRSVEMSPLQRFRSTIAHPNVAYILMTLGGLGLYFELANPGSILPGVIGAICLILAFYAFSILPVNYAGVALIILAALLFLAEIKVTSYGLLTLGGVVSLVLGSTMLFKTVDPAIRVSLNLILGLAGVTVAIVLVLTTMVLRAHGHRVRTGSEGLVRERGVARTDLDPAGKVTVHGEVWKAEAEGPLAAGDPVEVVAVDGMTLKVRRIEA